MRFPHLTRGRAAELAGLRAEVAGLSAEVAALDRGLIEASMTGSRALARADALGRCLAAMGELADVPALAGLGRPALALVEEDAR